MFDNNKKVVSNIVALSGGLVAPETAQATWNRSNTTSLIKTNLKSSAAEEAEKALNKVRATKKTFDHVKREASKAINKATNIRNNALKKVNQADEIAEAAKEDWETKVITAVKKLKNLESNTENKYLIKQAKQAQNNANKAKENFEAKKSEATEKRWQLQKYQERLAAIIQEQNNQIEVAELAYKQAQIEQQQAILRADNSHPAYGHWAEKYIIKDSLKNDSGFQVLTKFLRKEEVRSQEEERNASLLPLTCK